MSWVISTEIAGIFHLRVTISIVKICDDFHMFVELRKVGDKLFVQATENSERCVHNEGSCRK